MTTKADETIELVEGGDPGISVPGPTAATQEDVKPKATRSKAAKAKDETPITQDDAPPKAKAPKGQAKPIARLKPSEAEAPKPFFVTLWHGRPLYNCRCCPYNTTEIDRMMKHVTKHALDDSYVGSGILVDATGNPL